MNYKTIIYVISILISTFALSGINFDGFIKKNHKVEARLLIIILSFALGYLFAEFIINFININ